MKNRFILGVLVSAICGTTVQAELLQKATVQKMENDVQIVRNNAPVPAKVQDVINGKDVIKTGLKSLVELEFQDKTLARVGSNAIFSFKQGSRDFSLKDGVMLLQVPKGSGGAKIATAAATAAVTGTTIMLETDKNGLTKMIVLEGSMNVGLPGNNKDVAKMKPGQMIIIPVGATSLPPVVDVDLQTIMRSSKLVNGGSGRKELSSEKLILKEVSVQEEKKASGELVDTGLVVQKDSVTVNDPSKVDPLDADFGLPDGASEDFFAFLGLILGGFSNTDLTLIAGNPYVIGGGTTINTDADPNTKNPTITSNGVVDQGKFYSSDTDGSPTYFAFGSEAAPLDEFFNEIENTATAAVYLFDSVELAGNPNVVGSEDDVALVAFGDIYTSGSGSVDLGDGTLVLMSSFGNVDISNYSFSGSDGGIRAYARFGDLTYADSLGINLPGGTVKFAAGNNLMIDADITAAKIRMAAVGDVHLGAAGPFNFSANDISIESVSGSVVATNIAFSAGSIYLGAGQDVFVQSLAGDTVALSAGNDINATSITATNSLTLFAGNQINSSTLIAPEYFIYSGAPFTYAGGLNATTNGGGSSIYAPALTVPTLSNFTMIVATGTNMPLAGVTSYYLDPSLKGQIFVTDPDASFQNFSVINGYTNIVVGSNVFLMAYGDGDTVNAGNNLQINSSFSQSNLTLVSGNDMTLNNVLVYNTNGTISAGGTFTAAGGSLTGLVSIAANSNINFGSAYGNNMSIASTNGSMSFMKAFGASSVIAPNGTISILNGISGNGPGQTTTIFGSNVIFGSGAGIFDMAGDFNTTANTISYTSGGGPFVFVGFQTNTATGAGGISSLNPFQTAPMSTATLFFRSDTGPIALNGNINMVGYATNASSRIFLDSIGSNITVANVNMDGTNGFSAQGGAININTLVTPTNGTITAGPISVSGGSPFSNQNGGKGGSVTIRSSGDLVGNVGAGGIQSINANGGNVSAVGTPGPGGNISLTSLNGSVLITNVAGMIQAQDGAFGGSTRGTGGVITVAAPNGSVKVDNTIIYASSMEAGMGGKIDIISGATNSASGIKIQNSAQLLALVNATALPANGGAIRMFATNGGSVTMSTNVLISAGTNTIGSADSHGLIDVSASQNITLDNARLVANQIKLESIAPGGALIIRNGSILDANQTLQLLANTGSGTIHFQNTGVSTLNAQSGSIVMNAFQVLVDPSHTVNVIAPGNTTVSATLHNYNDPLNGGPNVGGGTGAAPNGAFGNIVPGVGTVVRTP